MGRKAKQVSTLHGFTIEELINLKNTHECSYARRVLITIILRYAGHSPKEIIQITGTTNGTINNHLDKWNKLGIKALEDNRGGSEPTFTSEMEDDLIKTVLQSSPSDHGFVAHTWSCSLLSQYIENNYGEKYSISWIDIVLKRNNLSYKRAQAKPTKAIKEEQEKF